MKRAETLRFSTTTRRLKNAQNFNLTVPSSPIGTMTQDLLARGIAYEMQVRQIGGLTPTEKKALGALAQGRSNPSPGALKAGTRLYRSWRGVTQEVLVLESGYSWRSKSYASLSGVARAITGTR